MATVKKNIVFLLVVAIIIILSASFFLRNPNKPNVIIIVLDSLRPDHLGCYGYYRNTSPNIDSFGKEGVIFRNVLSQGSWTVMSVASLMTSTYAGEHRTFKTETDLFYGAYMNPDKPTISELFKKNGYVTSLITDTPVLSLLSGLRRGFDFFISAGCNDPRSTTESAIKWIKENKNKKIFAYIHYFGPHAPFYPNFADKLKESLKDSDIYLPLQDYDYGFGIIPIMCRDNGILTLNHYINNYDGKILLLDRQIGRLLQSIKELNLEKNTMVIITADHGLGFGEHSLYCWHIYALYNEIIRVPLIIRFPDERLNNKIITSQSALLDLLPTITGYAGIRSSKHSGVNLIPVVKGGQSIKKRIIFSEEPKLSSCITDGKYKLIYNFAYHPSRKKFLPESQFELYDLANDPKEQDNIYSRLGIGAMPLQDELIKRYNKNKPMVEPNQGPPKDIKLKDIEKLKSLGYVN